MLILVSNWKCSKATKLMFLSISKQNIMNTLLCFGLYDHWLALLYELKSLSLAILSKEHIKYNNIMMTVDVKMC